MLIVSELFIYPVKSLGGITLNSAKITDRGFEYDRRWMLVDENNQFLSQRQIPEMALLQTEITKNGVRVFHKQKQTVHTLIPFDLKEDSINVQVWEDNCMALTVSNSLNKWFSDQLQLSCKLVYMPDNSIRKVDPDYLIKEEVTSFSDGFPFLLIGQSSLDDLNKRLVQSIPINRFRPNIVFTGGYPFEEDALKEFKIKSIMFSAVKPCARCVVTTIDQENAMKGIEPLKTLSSFRLKNNKIYFGQNLLHNGTGEISVGDTIEIIQKEKNISFY